MPKPHHQECPACGLKYEDFRTGLTFQDVKDTFWSGSDDPADWKYSRRHSVLGRWHQMKLELWTEHTDNCGQIANKHWLAYTPKWEDRY
jgi:hypothetical protein